MKRTGHVFGGVAAVVAALALAACGSSSSSSTTHAAQTSTAASASTSPSSASGVVVKTAKASGGIYLVGPNGHALYMWKADSMGKSNCSGACAQAWKPLTTTGKPTASGGAKASDLGTTTRSDGKKQVTYKGLPLYYWVGDTAAGQTTGQGSNQFGAKWYLVAPSGTPITSSSSSSSSSSGSSSGGSSSGGGGGWG